MNAKGYPAKPSNSRSKMLSSKALIFLMPFFTGQLKLSNPPVLDAVCDWFDKRYMNFIDIFSSAVCFLPHHTALDWKFHSFCSYDIKKKLKC